MNDVVEGDRSEGARRENEEETNCCRAQAGPPCIGENPHPALHPLVLIKHNAHEMSSNSALDGGPALCGPAQGERSLYRFIEPESDARWTSPAEPSSARWTETFMPGLTSPLVASASPFMYLVLSVSLTFTVFPS